MTIFGITVDPNNLEGSIVDGVDMLIEQKVASAFPATTKLKTLNASVNAVTATAREVVDLYVTSKAIAGIDSLLTSLATKYPVASTEINALKARLSGVTAAK